MVEARSPAAAGMGMPTKYFRPGRPGFRGSGSCEILNRARREAPLNRNRKHVNAPACNSDVHADAAEPEVIAHHPRPADGFEEVENLLAFAKRIHHRGARRPPMSCTKKPMRQVWFCSRVDSAMMTRMYSARSGTASPASFSTVSA